MKLLLSIKRSIFGGNPSPAKRKVFNSLPQEQEDEAVACFDRQGDQNVFTSESMEQLPDGRQRDRERDRLFYFVFGYAQAKGWTDGEERLSRRGL